MVVIFVEAANGHLLFAAPQLALDVVVFPAVTGFQCQSAVGPELSFGAETMRGLDQCHRQSRANRSQGGNLPQFGSDRMLCDSPPAVRAGLAGASAAACPVADKVAQLGGECRPLEFSPATHCDGGYSRRPVRHKESPSCDTALSGDS